jgi:hypothetical protein
MGNSYAISALTDKRAEIAGKILDLERQLRVHRSELMHLDAAMTLLDPSIKPHSIRAKQPLADRSGHFGMGEISQRCYDGLREGGEKGISPDEIAVKAMADKELDPGDQAMRRDFMRRFHWALARIQGQDKADKIGTGKGVRWRLREHD